MNLRSLIAASSACVVASITHPAPAQDLFFVTATGGGTTLTASDSDIIDLIEDLIETEGAFDRFNGVDTNATLTYAGVPDTFVFDVSGDGRVVTLSFPLTGFTRTFRGDDADDVEEQIEEFFEEDGAEEYANLLAELNRRSIVSVFDGNPFATTAILNRGTFQAFAIGQAGPAWANPNTYTTGQPGSYGWFSINPNIYDLQPDLDSDNDGSTDDIDAVSGGLSANGGFMFGRTIGLSVNATYQFNDFGGTEVYHSGITLGVPINLVGEDAVGLQLTPFATSGVGGSTDAAAGGAFYGFGVAANLRLSLDDRLVFNIGNQLVYYHGYDITYDDYEFSTELDQSLFTTGVLATLFLDRPGGNFFIDGGVTYTAYLDDAAVDNWITPEVGVGWRFAGNSRVRAGYRALLSDRYDAHGLNVNLVFTY